MAFLLRRACPAPIRHLCRTPAHEQSCAAVSAGGFSVSFDCAAAPRIHEHAASSVCRPRPCSCAQRADAAGLACRLSESQLRPELAQ